MYNNQQQFITSPSPAKALSPAKQLEKGVGFEQRIEKTIEKMVGSSNNYYNSGSFKKITFKKVTKKTTKDGITTEKEENAYVNSASKASTLLDTLSNNRGKYYLFNTLLQTSGIYENVLNYFASKFTSGLTKLEYNSMIIFGVFCLQSSSFTTQDVDMAGLLTPQASSQHVYSFLDSNAMKRMILEFTSEIKSHLLGLESTDDQTRYESIYNYDSSTGGSKLANLVQTSLNNQQLYNFFGNMLGRFTTTLTKGDYLKTIMGNKAQASDKIITLDNVYNIAVDAGFIKLDKTPFENFKEREGREGRETRDVGRYEEKLNSYARSYKIVKIDRKDQTYSTGAKETSDLILNTVMGFFHQNGDTQEQQMKKNEKLNKLRAGREGTPGGSYIDFAEFPDKRPGTAGG